MRGLRGQTVRSPVSSRNWVRSVCPQILFPRRKTMRKDQSLIVLVALTTLNVALAQDAKAPSPNGASNEQTTIGQVQIEQYLMDRSEEIAMARTAAPESVSRDAEVMVFGRHG